MPNWKQLLDELKAKGSAHDIVRRDYLEKLHEVTGRNIIAYYSGWLQKGGLQGRGVDFSLNDSDKNGFMTTIHELDRTKGLDLILHTPGGSTSALESLVDYLRQLFGNNIRAIVPQLALSAGTMIALACNEIVMGKHSSLGPIDPQIAGLPAHAIIEEFQRAQSEIGLNNFMALLWQPILQKYHPTMIGACLKAIRWSEEMTKEWLKTGMFEGDLQAQQKADAVVAELGSHAVTLSHDRHISLDRARSLGLNVKALEDDDQLQDAVLSVHHLFIQTLSETSAFKIIENHKGVALIQQVQQVMVAVP
jgi:ClpP class serine protease